MPDRLDQKLVESSLRALPEWSGDTTAISRTVSVTDAQAEQLLGSLAESARAMNHDPDIERSDGSLRIDLTTHSAGGPAEHVAAHEVQVEAVDVSEQPSGGEEDLVNRGLRRAPD